ncbi:MAG: DUF4263 domain-containing protein [Planctomycetes bacterium]|nr:DUF4263 domain-containing protein [Planctomycetota bacterium]
MQDTTARKVDAIRRRLSRRLTSLGVTPTPQAVAALVQSIHLADHECLGDTDTILGGLLFSGSYTVDLLETSGVSARQLRTLVLDGLKNPQSMNYKKTWTDLSSGSADFLLSNSPVLSNAIAKARDQDGVLETSHILTSAVMPEIALGDTDSLVPLSQRTGTAPTSEMLRVLEEDVCQLVSSSLFYIRRMWGSTETPKSVLASRHSRLNDAEERLLDWKLGASHPRMELDEFLFIVDAINAWFTRRIVLTSPAETCLRAVHRCLPLLFGPGYFASAGGDLKSLDTGIDLAKRYSPERDLAGLALFERSGRIYVGQYTYRNTLLVDTHVTTGYPLRRVSVQAVRPVSLIPNATLAELESLVSSENTQESAIQSFLAEHPEILGTLGYASALPHVCLRTEDNQSLVPDFLLELPGTSGFDILDLKLPSARLVARSPYLRMSSELVKAVAQLRKYRTFFERAENRNAFHRRYGLQAFRPELVVVMGRSDMFYSRDERVEVKERLGEIRLLTYDELIAYGQSRSLLTSTRSI